MNGLWGLNSTKLIHNVKVIELANFSSDHDRACELFYKIKGGLIDYGYEHSKQHDHKRFGRYHQNGIYPLWDQSNPVHLVGYSLGSRTILKLQYLLEHEAFTGFNTSANWIKSITNVAGALNGTSAIYILGLNNSGIGFPFLSTIQILMTFIHLWEWIDSKYLKSFIDFNLDQFELSRKKTGIKGFFKALIGYSNFSSGKDWAGYDLSFQSALQFNKIYQTHPNIYYFSYCITQCLPKVRDRTVISPFIPSRKVNILLFIFSALIGRKRFKPAPYDGFDDSQWWENDGIVPLYSQLYPWIGLKCEPSNEVLFWSKKRETGKWFVEVDHFEHLDILLSRRDVTLQKRMWRFLFEVLRNVD